MIYSIRELLLNFYILPRQEAIRRTYFPDDASLYETFSNVSIILLNGHNSFNQPLPLVPNMIPIGGFHIQPPKKLPKKLSKIVDDAKNGVVFVSMGSTLKSNDLPLDKLNILLRSFSRLKEKVLWKWEDDNLPYKPNNVEISNWYPQSDILGM